MTIVTSEPCGSVSIYCHCVSVKFGRPHWQMRYWFAAQQHLKKLGKKWLN